MEPAVRVPRNLARLLISCPDRPGIVAAVSRFLFERGANIVRSDQHSTDPAGGVFFMRVEFDLPDLERRGPELERDFAQVAASFGMDWRLAYASRVKRLAIFVSRAEHCLFELLWQVRSGDLRAEVAMVISNHPDLRETIEAWGLPFHHVPAPPAPPATPATPATPAPPAAATPAARRYRDLLGDRVDLIVLARFMQILPPEFVARYPNRIINIHHSFLPAFVGANPYVQAYERGVKLIGATAHYVTDELDAGPIIAQDVQRVDHRDNVEDLKRIGRHIERVVLARAVAWHVEDRILVYGNKTVVFA